MKRVVIFLSSIAIFFSSYPLASGQEAPKVCNFSLVGTWQQTTEGHTNATLLRFNPNGVVTVISPDTSAPGSTWQEADWSTYTLDNPQAPKTIQLLPIVKNGEAAKTTEATSLDVTKFDDGTFTTAVASKADVELTRWNRIDGQRYFIVLAAAKGTPGYGAPAFATLIKTDRRQVQSESFGLYETDAVHHFVIMGPISEELRKRYEREPDDDSAALLRMEVAAGPYQRALKILKTWERRARENTMLYQIPYLDNAVFLNQLASSLNDCAETIKLEKLTWRIDDQIITKQNLPQVPYFFIKNLRQENEDLHVKDDRFFENRQAASLPPRQ